MKLTLLLPIVTTLVIAVVTNGHEHNDYDYNYVYKITDYDYCFDDYDYCADFCPEEIPDWSSGSECKLMVWCDCYYDESPDCFYYCFHEKWDKMCYNDYDYDYTTTDNVFTFDEYNYSSGASGPKRQKSPKCPKSPKNPKTPEHPKRGRN